MGLTKSSNRKLKNLKREFYEDSLYHYMHNRIQIATTKYIKRISVHTMTEIL